MYLNCFSSISLNSNNHLYGLEYKVSLVLDRNWTIRTLEKKEN